MMQAKRNLLGREEDEFLKIACAVLVDGVTKRLQNVPAAVGDIAYDDAVTAIMRRAGQGVAGFRDERGRQSPERIKAYVKYVLDRKLKGAWGRVEPTVPLDDEHAAADTDVGDDAGAAAERLARDDEQDELLARARLALRELERRARQREDRRMSWIANLLIEHGIADPGARLVMLRAAREIDVGVTERGVTIRYLPAAGLPAIARTLGITHVCARKLSSRTLRKLPPAAARIIDDPEVFPDSHPAG